MTTEHSRRLSLRTNGFDHDGRVKAYNYTNSGIGILFQSKPFHSLLNLLASLQHNTRVFLTRTLSFLLVTYPKLRSPCSRGVLILLTWMDALFVAWRLEVRQ